MTRGLFWSLLVSLVGTPLAPILGTIAPVLGTPLAAQRAVPVSSWVTEIGAGAGTDLFARGPWINPLWRRSFVGRVGIATGLSLIYEWPIEWWNGDTNCCRVSDVKERLVGTLGAEVLWWIGRKVLK